MVEQLMCAICKIKFFVFVVALRRTGGGGGACRFRHALWCVSPIFMFCLSRFPASIRIKVIDLISLLSFPVVSWLFFKKGSLISLWRVTLLSYWFLGQFQGRYCWDYCFLKFYSLQLARRKVSEDFDPRIGLLIFSEPRECLLRCSELVSWDLNLWVDLQIFFWDSEMSF